MSGTKSLIARPEKAVMSNPETGELSPVVIRLLLQLVSTLTGTGIGLLEGFARVGKLDAWANLAPGWKSTIFGGVAGVSMWLEQHWAPTDPEKSRAMFALNSVSWSHAVMYGTIALIEESTDDAPDIQPKGEDKAEGKTEGGLMIQRGLAALASEDASAARQAIEEVVAHREEMRRGGEEPIDLGAIPVQAMEAMVIDFSPRNLSAD